MLVEEEPAALGARAVLRRPRRRRAHAERLVVALDSSRTRASVVLPHERTHAGPKEGRLRLLRATRAQLEPIFLLHDGRPGRAADARARTSTSRARGSGGVDDACSPMDLDDQLLIADGHHRYETALAFHDEDGTDGERVDDGRARLDA